MLGVKCLSKLRPHVEAVFDGDDGQAKVPKYLDFGGASLEQRLLKAKVPVSELVATLTADCSGWDLP